MVNDGLLAGIDFGTTSCKAGIVSLDGRELAHGSVPTPWRHVPTGAELAPDAFVDAALAAVEQAHERAGGGTVLGVGVTSMAETGVLLGAGGAPVAPSIAWYDSRGEAEVARILDELTGREFTTRTGLPARPLCTISKYLWLRRHEPAAAGGRRWLNVAEWIVHRLGADQASELSLASRTGWLDIASQSWWDEALTFSDAPQGFLPDPVPAGTNLGTVSAGPDWLRGATLTVGGHDHLCGAIGAGATGEDVVYDSCGTAEAFIGQLSPPASNEQVLRLVDQGITVGWHAIPGRLAMLGAQRSGLALQRFRDMLGVDRGGYLALDIAALDAPADAGGLSVVDHDGDTAALAGIPHSPSPGLVWRAALNAVSERSAAILRTMQDESGGMQEVVVAGGWARSAAFRLVKEAYQGPFQHAAGLREAGVRGAALLAGLAAGTYRDVGDLPAVASGPMAAAQRRKR